MKLNDPFGRMENRHQLGYESMRDAMRKGGINTSEAALQVIEQSKSRGQQYILVGLIVLLLITIISPNILPVTLSLGVLLVVFITKSTRNGKRYIQRYIDEELSEKE